MNVAKNGVMLGAFRPASDSLRSLFQQADGMGLKYVSLQCSLYLAQAYIGMKKYDLAKTELENTLNASENLGLQSLLAQSQFLLARALDLSGKSSEAQDHYKQARQIADGIQKEARTETITKRSDLSPIFAHPS